MITEGSFLSVLHKNILCGYSESPRQGNLISTHNMFLWENKQNYPLIITKYLPYLSGECLVFTFNNLSVISQCCLNVTGA